MLVLAAVACGEAPTQLVEDELPTPDAFACEEEPSQVCSGNRPTLALAANPTVASSPLYVAAGAGELHRVSLGVEGLQNERVGWISSQGFVDQTRLMACDIDGDGISEVVCSDIDALASGYVVWGDPAAHGGFLGQRTTPERLQAARCLDVDGDAHDDLVGLLDAGRLGVLRGAIAGLADTPVELAVDIGDPALLYYIVAAAGDVNDDGKPEWLWTTIAGSSVTTWTVDIGSSAVTVLTRTDFGPDVRALGLELADLNGDTQLDLVLRGLGDTDEGRVLVAAFDAAGHFGSPAELVIEDTPRRVWAADVDDDGDDELVVVGAWNDGVVLADYSGNELDVVRHFDVLANDGLPLLFDDDELWDLAVVHADTWRVEIIPNAFGAPQ